MTARPSVGRHRPSYADLHLRRNPFGALEPDERGEVAVVDLEPWGSEIERRLREPAPGLDRLSVQLVGPPGSGKSTHLAALARRFPSAGHIAWSHEEGWGMLREGELLLVDDAHMMPRRLLKEALRRPVTVLATHRDLGVRLRGRGRQVRVVDVPGATGASRVRAIVRRRLEWARRGDGAVPQVDWALLDRLIERHGHDLRRIVGTLYDHLEDLRETG